MVLSCLSYSIMSNSMVLVNRALVSQLYFGFAEKTFILLIQNLLAVLVLEWTKSQGGIEYESLDWTIVKAWTPVSFFFVCMLYTNTQATSTLPIHIVVVFKNVTNLGIVFGEWFFFNGDISILVLGSLAIMVLGAGLSSYSEVHDSQSVNTIGYVWMTANCAMTAAYVLYMRYATTNSSLKLSRFGMAFYNNLISAALLLPAMVLSGEAISAVSNPLLTNMGFLFCCGNYLWGSGFVFCLKI